MLHIYFKFELSSILMRASNSGVITIEERNALLSKCYIYAQAHPSAYIPALVVLIRIIELKGVGLICDAEKEVDEIFDIPHENRPNSIKCDENYNAFLIFYVTAVF